MFWRKTAAAREMGLWDIHTHILPGVDDGAPDLPAAMDLLRQAYEDGTRAMFLTPHYRGRYRQNSPALLQEVFADLCRQAQQELPDLKLYLGNEIHYEMDAPENLLAGRILAMNSSRYCLLEFRAASLRSQIVSGVSAMLNCGYIPIIAHAERYDIFLKDKTLADEVLEMGALIQLNASGILSAHSWAEAAFCRRLLREQKVHFIATDAHDTVKRPPLLRRCFQKVSNQYGPEYAQMLFRENPRAVAENDEI